MYPGRPSTAYTIPLNGDQLGRYMPDAQLAVWRTTDDGASWERLTDRPARARMGGRAAGGHGHRPERSAGIWFGTSTGQLFGSRDAGDTWSLVADLLPGIRSVETAVLAWAPPA
ncbi:MAG: hypothetical protein R3C32_13290 [Chloroflexota bacterium]